MTFHKPPKYFVIDDFLPAALLAGLLEYALEKQDSFAPTEVKRNGELEIDYGTRLSLRCQGGLGPHKAAFKTSVHSRLDEIFRAIGIAPFPLAKTEIELVSHGDNAFFKSHIDTFTKQDNDDELSARVVSAVFYFYREPKSFSGGEIALFPFGDGEGVEVLEPRQNRLVAFPSFTLHEVRKISCPSGEFADSRFAINCWLRKATGMKSDIAASKSS